MVLATAPETGLSASETRHLGVLEKRIAAGLQTFREVGASLLEIRDSRLYRATHSSFEAYCAERWAMPRSRAYQLIESAKVVDVLGDPAGLNNEAQARELASLVDEPDVAKRVWFAAEARTRETNKPMTAALIRQVKAEVAPDDLQPTITRAADNPTERLVQDITRLGNTYQRWLDTKPRVGDRQKVKAAVRALVRIIGS